MKSHSICMMSFWALLSASVGSFLFFLIFMVKGVSLFIEWQVIEINSMEVVISLLFDWMSLLFMSFVLFISSMVSFYSYEYMGEEKSIERFMLLVLLFVGSMVILILSPNLISILLGWDGLGLVSYCLVIYFQNVSAYNAGMLTALSNRVGDVALLLAISWMLNFGSWNFTMYLDFMQTNSEMQIVGWFVLVAAMTKSAQLPFSSWLPAAMAAPTPVSALVHSSTLVTAGVYLLIRFNLVLDGGPMKWVLLFVGGLTMFMAGLGANFEFDLKKIIALSTLSQLGLMMSILGVGFYKMAFFHLLTHALFKALLFLCAGALIHSMNNFQDIRFMGGIVNCMPLTLSCMNVANLALCGMPFLAGFYSKDLILEAVLMSPMNVFAFFIFFMSTGLTVSYSARLVYYSLLGPVNLFPLHSLMDESKKMQSSMVCLTGLSVFAGGGLMWVIFPSPIMVCLPFFMKIFTITVCLIGGFLGYYISYGAAYSSFYSISLNQFSGSMWFTPYISTYGSVSYPLLIGGLLESGMNQGWSEEMGSQALIGNLEKMSKINLLIQASDLKIFFLTFALWIFILSMLLLFIFY